MAVVVCACVLNEEEWILPWLRNVSSVADRIVVAEGAVAGYPLATGDGHSVDGTSEMLAAESAGKDRIIVVTNNGFWESKQDQQNSLIRFVNDGDWFVRIDADEFVPPETVEALISQAQENGWSQVVLKHMHFWRDAHHCAGPDSVLRTRHQRLIKYRSGMRFLNHPTLAGPEGKDTFYQEPHLKTKVNTDDLIYHFGFCKDIFHQAAKRLYYAIREGRWTRFGVSILGMSPKRCRKLLASDPLFSDLCGGMSQTKTVSISRVSLPMPGVLSEHRVVTQKWDEEPYALSDEFFERLAGLNWKMARLTKA